MNLSKFIVACCGVFFIILSEQVLAAQCSAVFPDVIATHGNGNGNSRINFGFDSRLINNPDTVLSTLRIDGNSNFDANSCGSADCTASNTSAETASVNFRRGGGSVNYSPPSNQTTTFGELGANNYNNINALSNATLGFSDNYNVYFFERLALGFNNTLNLSAGKTYYIRQFSAASNATINVVGTGTALVFIDSNVTFTSPATINSAGQNQTGDTSKLVMHVEGNVNFGSRSTFSGALYARNITFTSASYLFGVASGLKVELKSNSVLTYDSNVFNANFGEVCEQRASIATPIANFKFDETEYADVAGEVRDSVGTFHGQAKSAQPVEGKVCRAIDLSATRTSDYVVLNKDIFDNRREFSISLWAKTAKTRNQTFVSGANSGSIDELTMWFSRDVRFRPYLQNVQGNLISSPAIASNTWRHLVWTHGNNQSCLFVDKVRQNCITQATSTLDIDSLIVGQGYGSNGRLSSSQAFNGLLDELVFYDQVIGQEQVNQIYDYQNNGLDLDGEPISCGSELIAQFSMDESPWSDSVEQVIDTTGNYNAQAVNGATTDDAAPALTGNPGTCGYGEFDGNNDYIELPNSFENLQDSFTITAWINPKNLDSGSRIFIDDEKNQRGFGFSMSDQNNGNGHLRFYSRGVRPVSVDTAGGVISTDTWTFVAAVHNKGAQTRQIYVNGVAQVISGGSTTSSYTGTWGIDTGPASIGGETNRGETNNRFTGAIDEVHVFKGALNATEINAIYQKRHACSEPAIHHYEIVHDGNGLTCAAEPITIRACSNASCSSLSTDPVSLNLSVNGVQNSSVTFTGSTDFNDPTFSFNHITPEVITLSVAGASIAASNPFECSGVGTSCNMTFDNAGFILDINSGNNVASCSVNNSLAIRAVKLGDNGVSCAPAFTGEQSLNFTFDRINPTTIVAVDKTTTPSLSGVSMEAAGVRQTRNVTFNSNGEATLPFRYDEAGQIEISVSEVTSSGVREGNVTKSFYPSKLVASTALNSTDHSGGDTQKAGENFSITMTASCPDEDVVIDNYKPQTDTSIELSVQQQAPVVANGTLITSSQGISILATDSSTTQWSPAKELNLTFNAIYDEVGILNIAVRDRDYFGSSINSGPAEYISVGRFIPHHFILKDEGVVNYLTTSTYMGQPELAFEYQIEAQNLVNEITKNYTGDYAKSSVTFVAENGNDGKPLGARLAGYDSVWNNGVYSGSGIKGSFTRLAEEIDGPFDEMLFGLQFIDPDGGIHDRMLNMNADETGNCIALANCNAIALSTTPSQIRFGRWHIENAYGPETSSLPLPMSIQFWNGNAFVNNVLDSKTVFDSVKMSKIENDISPSTTTLSGQGTFSSGSTRDVILTAPSPSARGEVPVTYDIDSLPWLQFDWKNTDSTRGPFNNNPEATATFGLYRGNDRIISWREVVN
jgi:MSHA biogenesis protein MshQ